MREKIDLPPTIKALLLAMDPGKSYHETCLPKTPFCFAAKGPLVKRGLALRMGTSSCRWSPDNYWNYTLSPEGEALRAKILSEEGAK